MLAQQPDFLRGAEEAMIVLYYGQGMLKEEQHPLILEAKSDAAAMGKADNRSAIAVLMMTQSLTKEVRRLAASD